MTPLTSRSERLVFARLLEVDPDELLWLDELDPADVRAARDRVSDVLFEQGAGHLGDVLQASRLLPRTLVARIGQAVFPPLLAAQMAGLLDPGYAGALVSHFQPAYLADLGAAADPRHLDHLVPELPDEVLITVAHELVARGDHMTAGRLVGLAAPRLFPVLVDDVADDGALFEIACFIEHPEAIDPIIDCIDDERLARMLLAATDRDRWVEALALVTHLGPANAQRMAGVVAHQPTETLSALLDTALVQGTWAPVLDLVGHLGDDDLRHLAAFGRLSEPEVVAATARAADGEGRQLAIARMAAAMGDDDRERVRAGLEAVDGPRVAQLAAAARAAGLIDRVGWA